ncbi:MAG: hypothetical protein JWN39_3729 [Ilumatobacteraceae bacterium]|nr:hypothetical protein [Ilumatobacteraceae bacterium]
MDGATDDAACVQDVAAGVPAAGGVVGAAVTVSLDDVALLEHAPSRIAA